MSLRAWRRAGAAALAFQLATVGAQAEGEREAPPISLPTILAYADEHAPRVLVARAETERGEAAVESASVLLQDNLIAGGSAGPRFADGEYGIDYQVWLRQPFEIAGERKQRRKTAEKTKVRFAKDLEEVRWQVHCDVHAAFHFALVARERSSLAEKILVSTQELLSVAERRHQAGDISQLAVRLAEGELAQARQALLASEQEYRAAQLRLVEVSGWPADVPPEPVGELDQPRHSPPVDELLALALADHPGIAARTRAVAEAKARVQLEDREAWPEPSLGVIYTRESLPISRLHEHILQGAIRLPIPTTQRNQGARARARAELSVAEAEEQAFVQVLEARLARASNAVDADAARIAAYGTEILPAFEGNLALLRRAFELGEADLLQVLVARERLLRMQQDALTAHQDYYRDVAALEAEVGADVWADEHHPQPSDVGEPHDD